jgi:hypothetical protein
MPESHPKRIGRPRIDLTGKRFGRFTAIAFHPRRTANGSSYWLCRCDCGVEKLVQYSNLKSGNQQSCGCLRRDLSSDWNRTHGMKNTPEYAAWHAMRHRCDNPNNAHYADYGGRGITVCKRWEKFENFYADMGKRPPNLTLERNDVNGNYEAGNCRWASRKDQQRNRRNARFITFNGETNCLAVWAEKLGISYRILYARTKKTSDPAELLRPVKQRPVKLHRAR